MDVMRDRHKKGFTLIELLVVISIIALLLSILMPGLQKAKQKAKEVLCRANLKQWGVLFTLYSQDYEDSLPIGWNGGTMWMTDLMAYYQGTDDLRNCPSVKKFITDIPDWSTAIFGSHPMDSTFIGWGVHGQAGWATPYWSEDGMYGSYGVNAWVMNPLDAGVPGTYNTNDAWKPNYFRKMTASSAYQIPLMGGSKWDGTHPLDTDSPPQRKGVQGSDMSNFCLDRHNGGLNMVFMDASTRKVGLKELWTLKWHKNFDRSKKPDQWPEWMSGYKDY